MGGRKLGPDELGCYVTFAVDVLDHPELIWKHAFEHEIDDHGRALMLVLASLTRPTEVEHVEAAFDALCRHRGLALSGQAFRRTLSALDDSLVGTRHGSGTWAEATGVLVATHNPSVADFLGDYVRASPADAEDLAEAALFFEQASWLWSVAAGDGDVPERLTAVLTAALERTYEAPGLSPVIVPLSTHSWTHRPAGTVDHEARLRHTLELAERAGSQRDALVGWCRDRLSERLAAWDAGNGEPPSILKLLEAVRRDDRVDADAAARSAAGAMEHKWDIVQETEWKADLRALFPAAYTRGEWDTVVDEFASWLEADLASSANDMTDTDELRLVERVANRLGIVIDQDELDAADESVRENVAEAEERAGAGEEDWEPRVSAASAVDSRLEVEAIFERLADGA